MRHLIFTFSLTSAICNVFLMQQSSVKINNRSRVSIKKLCLLLSLVLFSVCCISQGRYISVTTKKIVYSRDGGSCICCGSFQNLEFDHITPYSCGGTSDVSNIQLLCKNCNRSKSNSCYCKVHDKKVGTDCCDEKTLRSKTKAYTPKKSSTTSKQCTGTTKKGARCRNMTTNSTGRCHLH